jgi:GTPase SAR1 family protein
MAGSQIKSAITSEILSFIRETWKGVKDNVLDKVAEKLEKSWRKAVKEYYGETLAVLGPPAAGKTTLLKVLGNPSIEEDKLTQYNKTEKESHAAIEFKYNFTIRSGEQISFKMKVRKNSDVGGELYIKKSHWASVIKDASVVIYLIDSSEFIKESNTSYKDRVLQDFEWLLEQHQLLKPNFSIIIGFNKVDELCTHKNYKKFTKDNAHHIEGLREEIVEFWPDELAAHIRSGLFLSLRDQKIRAFTMNSLVASFVGNEIIALYKTEEE